MNFFYLLYKAALHFIDRESSHYAAAFSYYAPLALIPLVVFSVSVVGLIYGESYTNQIFSNWGSVLGNDLFQVIKLAVSNLDIETKTSPVPIVGAAFSLGFYIIAMNLLSDGFQKLWDIKSNGVRGWVIKSLRSFAFLVILQIYLVFMIGLDFFVSLKIFAASTLISSILLFISTTAFFAALYHLLSVKSPRWTSCFVGATVSSLLFVGIKNLVDLYIDSTPALNLYGAAGLILILLVWVYVLAALIYYGAAVAGLYDKIKYKEFTRN